MRHSSAIIAPAASASSSTIDCQKLLSRSTISRACWFMANLLPRSNPKRGARVPPFAASHPQHSRSLAVTARNAYLRRMAIREILEVPDPRLKTVSTPVETFDDELRTLVDDMFETMYAAHGIGLAAIQVGVPRRVLVIDLQPEDPDAEPEECTAHGGHAHTHQPTRREPRIFINPEI